MLRHNSEGHQHACACVVNQTPDANTEREGHRRGFAEVDYKWVAYVLDGMACYAR